MSVVAPAPRGIPTASTLPAASLWRLWSCALSALVVLWLPLALLQELDALLVFTPARSLLADVALLLPMVAVAAAALAGLAWLAGCTAAARNAGPTVANRLAWAVLLVPIGWLCAWQITRSLRLWLQLTTGLQLGLGAHTRLIGIMLLLVVVLLLAWRFGAALAGRQLVGTLLALRAPAWWLVAAGMLWSLASPPLWQLGPAPRSAPLAAPGSAPDIVLISIDALAAGDAAVCGDGPTLMPNLRRLAQQASCFERFYTTSNFTTPTTSSMETGLLPWSHLATQIAAKVTPPLQQHGLAHRLREAGYQTHFLSDNFLASPRHHGTWHAYDDARYVRSGLLRNRLREALTVLPDSQIPLLVDTLLSFLGAFDVYLHAEHNPYDTQRAYAQLPGLLQAGRAPLFVWVHTMPPHAPYLPPAAFKHRLLPAGELDHWHQMLQENMPYPNRAQPLVDKHRLRYRESILGADAELGQLLDALAQAGRLDQAIVVVTSDHGESFERNFIGHAGPFLHEAVIRVPLVIKLPGQTTGRRIDLPVSQADLAPTLLDLVKAPALPQAEGRSLWPLLLGQALAPKPIYSMSMERQSRFRPITEGHYAVIDGHDKLVWDRANDSLVLYDLQVDPMELADLAPRRPEQVARLRGLLRKALQNAETARLARAGLSP